MKSSGGICGDDDQSCIIVHCQERGRLLRMLQSYVLSPVLMQLSVLDEKDGSEKIFIHSQLLQQQLVSKKTHKNLSPPEV